jgi:plastocyanin
VATAPTVGCLAGGPLTVEMTDGFRFAPQTATAATGETVRWTNASEVGHTVTARTDEIPAGAAYFASGGFETERAARNGVSEGLIAPGEPYEHACRRPGPYAYYCIPHEGSGMTGRVRIE